MAKLAAQKGNKVLQIEHSETKHYVRLGFDIVENGKVIEYGMGKTVNYGAYMKAVEKVEALEAEVKKLKAEARKAKTTE